MNKHNKIFIAVVCIALFTLLIVGCQSQSKEVSVPDANQNNQADENNANENDDGTGENQEEGNGELVKEEIIEEPKFLSPYSFEYPDAVRGIYVTSHSAGGARMQTLLELMNSTSLNAMVIDIKDDHGFITFPLEDDHPYKKYSKRNIADVHGLMQKLEDHKIYPIARIVVFKDTVLATDKPELSFLENGQVWKNRRQEAFVNPYLKEVWEYNVEIAKMAAELGFREIQFDYVRYPEGFENRDDILQYSRGDYVDKKPTKLYALEEAYEKNIVMYEKDLAALINVKSRKEAEVHKANTEATEAQAKWQSLKEASGTNSDEAAVKAAQTNADKAAEKAKTAEKELASLIKQVQDLEKDKPQVPNYTAKETAVQLRVDAVTDFVAYAREELKQYDVDVSVDIFGYTATIEESPGIGQNFTRISENVDVICSMIYPSHWGYHYFNIPKPDLEPYRLVKEYIIRENEKLATLENPPVSRPWIQDFTASYLGSGNYIKYGKKEVEDQIRALNEHGVWEFLLWNAGNTYSPGVNYLPIGKPPQ